MIPEEVIVNYIKSIVEITFNFKPFQGHDRDRKMFITFESTNFSSAIQNLNL